MEDKDSDMSYLDAKHPKKPLSEYLSMTLPALKTPANTTLRPNRPSINYSWKDITRISSWEDFTYDTIRQNYPDELDLKRISLETTDTCVEEPVSDRCDFVIEFSCDMLYFVRRALCATFDDTSIFPLRPHSPTYLCIGPEAMRLDSDSPDLVFAEAVKEEDSRTITDSYRCPGDQNVSWQWKSTWRTSTDTTEHREYKQVLSRVMYHMKQSHARYGFIATNAELVPVRRELDDGHLSVADAIPWTEGGQLTYLMGLWYLGMLAAGDDWKLEAS